MHIKRDVFRIESGAVELDGTKVEPEAQNVQHIFQGSAPVTLGGAGTGGAVPLEIVAHATAGQVARSVSALCGNCTYFRNEAWRAMLARCEGPAGTAAERHSVNAIRSQILVNMPDPEDHAGQDGDYDTEHALQSMGLCPALNEFYKTKGEKSELYGVMPTSGCPAETVALDRPMGLFKPRDAAAGKSSVQNYDAVMQRAAGKIR
jgi:hypothetical protein